MTELTIEQRVANGAAWLDERVPDWADRISLLKFDMREDCACVIGQVIGSYERVVGGLDNVISLAEAVERGFDAETRVGSFEALDAGSAECQPEFEALQAEWSKVITSRREAVSDAR